MMDWKKASREKIEQEFCRELDSMAKDDVIDIAVQLIPFTKQKDFVLQWHDELWSEE